MAIMERVTGIGGVFQRAGQAASLRDWYAEHLGIDISDWGGKPFEWTPGGSTTWAIFDHDTEYFGRPEQAFMVNFRVADLDAMLAQLRSAGVEVIDALDESELGRFGWAVDPKAPGSSSGNLRRAADSRPRARMSHGVRLQPHRSPSVDGPLVCASVQQCHRHEWGKRHLAVGWLWQVLARLGYWASTRITRASG